MNDTELQIVISAVNQAAGQLSEVSGQLTGLGTAAGEASTAISSSLNAAEEAAADAAIATASQWDESLDEVSSAVSEASTAVRSSFSSISDASLAAANAMSEGWQASIAELEETMAQADSEIVAGATATGEEAGKAAGEGFGGYFKQIILGYALEQIGTFLSGGISSAVADASKSTDQIAKLSAEIGQQKADIQVNEAALQKWVGTTAEVNAAHVKAAANIEAEREKISELTQQLAPLQSAQDGLLGQIQEMADKILSWVGAHKQLEDAIQTFMTTLGPLLSGLGALVIGIAFVDVAMGALTGTAAILILGLLAVAAEPAP